MKTAEGPPFPAQPQVAAWGTHAAEVLVGPSEGWSLVSTDRRGAEWGFTHWAPGKRPLGALKEFVLEKLLKEAKKAKRPRQG